MTEREKAHGSHRFHSQVPAGQLARVILPELIFVNHDDQHVRYDPIASASGQTLGGRAGIETDGSEASS